MKKTKVFSNYLNSLKADPIFVVLDSLYFHNPDASIYKYASANVRYSSLLGDLDRILYTDLNAEPPVSVRDLPFSRIFSLAEMIIFSLVNSKDILKEVMRPAYLGDYFLFHTLNVAFLSCQAAIGLGLSYKELTQVCVVALLHDIGMKFIDQGSFDHAGDLSESQREEVDRHFEISYQYFKNLEKDIPFLLKVIEEENRRLKRGQRKPDNQTDEESDIGKWQTIAELVSMCNKFEALCHDRPYRKAFHPADAMRHFVEANKQHYDHRFIRAIIDSVSLYPITSLVRLNNNRIGYVIDIVEGAPLSPIVAVVDETDDPLPDEPSLTNEVIDLSEKSTLFINELVYSKRFHEAMNPSS